MPEMNGDRAVARAVVAVDLRSCANVGNLARTASAFGFSHFFTVGTTPNLQRKEVIKAALGGEKITNRAYKTWVEWRREEPNWQLIALETGGQPLNQLAAWLKADWLKSDLGRKKPLAVIVGNERSGLPASILAQCAKTVTIPHQTKTILSLNVTNAFAILAHQIYAFNPKGESGGKLKK